MNELVCGCGDILACSPRTFKKYQGKQFRCRKCASKEAWSDPDRLKKASDLGKEIWSDGDPRRDSMLAAARDPRKLRKISASSKERWRKDKDGMMASIFTDESRTKISEAVQQAWKNPKYVEAQTQRSIDQWNDPIYRARGVENGKACWNNPEFVRKQQEARSTPEFKERMAHVVASQPRISSLQKRLYSYLTDLSVSFYEEGAETTIGPWVFDCAIPNKGGGLLLIECQGEYWHSRPQQVARDKAKFTYIEKYFPQHEVMYLFEREFSQKDGVLDKLKGKLGIEVEHVFFDLANVQIKSIESGIVSDFLDLYHYIGKGRGGESYGAYLNDDLIGVCVFSPPLRNNDDSVELSRFCIHPKYHKKDFASWFISRCVRSVDKTVVAFADTTVGHNGTIYKASNFRFDHEVPSDYWYVDSNGWVMHKLTLYKRARQNSKTEKEYADLHGFVKKWGGKKLCFIFDRRQ